MRHHSAVPPIEIRPTRSLGLLSVAHAINHALGNAGLSDGDLREFCLSDLHESVEAAVGLVRARHPGMRPAAVAFRCPGPPCARAGAR